MKGGDIEMSRYQAPAISELEQYFPMIGFILKRFSGIQKFDYEDLFQVGCLALIRCLAKYDSERASFSTYAFAQIRWSIMRYLTCNQPIKLSRLELETLNRIRKANLLDRESEDIAKELSIEDVDLIERSLELNQISILSTDQVITQGNKDVHLIDSVAVQTDLSSVFVEEFIGSLDHKEKAVIQLKLKGWNQDKIAKAVGVSQPHVGRLLKKIGRKYEDYQKSA